MATKKKKSEEKVQTLVLEVKSQEEIEREFVSSWIEKNSATGDYSDVIKFCVDLDGPILSKSELRVIRSETLEESFIKLYRIIKHWRKNNVG